nr:hypothetical protein [Niallia circulans]
MVKQQDGDLVKIANGAFEVMVYQHPGIKNYIINKSRLVDGLLLLFLSYQCSFSIYHSVVLTSC